MQSCLAHRGTTNHDIAHALREMSLFLEMGKVPWKPRAYEKAADSVAALDRPITELYASGGVQALDTVPNVGKAIAERIAELIESGHCTELDTLRRRTPVDVLALTAVEGLGPKRVKQLYDALGVRTLDDLEAAARSGQVRQVSHFGAKTEQRILQGVSFVRQSHGRVLLGDVLGPARDVERRLRALPGVVHAELAGSVRRRKETIGDIDVVVAASDTEAVTRAFVAMPEVAHVYARGPTKALVRLRSGIDADLRVVPEVSWGAALCYFTGSRAHSVALRRIAQEKGCKLNEYGLYRGSRRIAGRTEQEIYEALGLPFIEPELREDGDEIAAARAGKLPALIPYGALRGDLQVHTRWTDGLDTIQEMARGAKALGLSYLAITDHTRDLKIAGGLDEERLLAQVAAIRELDAKQAQLRILAGAEVNIRRDGTLDIPDRVLSQLDVVGAGVHSQFHLPRREMTARLIRALENPHVDILLHPTARVPGRRPALDVDLPAIFEAARRTGTALEVDGHPDRLDLKDEHVRQAIAHGVKLVISSDAHSVNDLRQADDFGVAVARRGWATCDDVLNTLPLPQFLRALGRAKR